MKPSEIFRESVGIRQKALGLSQKDLAVRMKKKQPQLSAALAQSGSAPNVDTLMEYAVALECQPWELLMPVGAKPTPRHEDFTLGQCAQRLVDHFQECHGGTGSDEDLQNQGKAIISAQDTSKPGSVG